MSYHRNKSLRSTLLATAGLLPLTALGAGELPQSISPLPQGYAERARLMELSENPLGTIDQLGRFDALAARDGSMLLAKAYYERGDVRCVELLKDFIARNPASDDVENARLLLADYYFFNHEFGPALLAYKEADIEALSPGDSSKYTYRKAVSMIKCGFYHEAEKPLWRLQKSNGYKGAATFYLGYLDYLDGNFDDAYRKFKESWEMEHAGEAVDAESAPSRRGDMRRRFQYEPTGLEAGYYMTQIEFRRGEYEKVIRNGRSLMQKMPVPELLPEMQRIVGESYYKTGEPEVARSFLESYAETPDITPDPSALYLLGTIEYNDGNYDAAKELFSRVTGENNDLAQSAYLYLGQCAVKSGETDLAAISFKKAYDMNFDPAVSEAALYNYIAATTRGGTVPFASSIPLLEEYVQKFRKSARASEVEEYLAVAYYNEKDYTAALKAINRISNPGAKVLAAKQKILFELGVRELSNGNAAEAEKHLREAQGLARFDRKIAAQVDLWLGDALYAQKKYANADKAYESYLKQGEKGDNGALALYNLGYSLYMQDKFNDAMVRFDEALAMKPGLTAALAADARMRKADCLYYTGRLNSASDLYAEIVKSGNQDADYAMMRQAVILGVNGDNAGKARMLGEMLERFPNSKWRATAMLEQAIAYTEDGATDKAIQAFNALVAAYPDAPETRNALLQLALLNNKAGDVNQAIADYQTLIRKWPTSEEAAVASDDLRIIFAREDRLDELVAFLKNIPGAPQLDRDEVEKLTYDAAATAYATGDDASKLQNYVARYPDGRYLAQALRDIAQYQFRDLHNPYEALATISRLVTTRPDSPQVPGALMLKGEILETEYPDRTEEILQTYRDLENRGGSEYAAEAWSGIMRNTRDAAEQLRYARMLKNANGVSADALKQATLYEAMALLSSSDAKQGEALLKELAAEPLTAAGARAAATLGEYYVKKGHNKEAVTLLEKFTDSGTDNYYWLARGYIALCDAYRASGKKALARQYISSLKENYPGTEADIWEMINHRINSWK